MNRTLSATLAAAGLVLATLTLAGPAQAITNPADNPHKITVKGDDGQTYTDGQDTLPGYDDEACTYIPGAYFDFDNNRVRYADGQSIPWTEWDRATGYKEWKAKKDAKADPVPSAPKTTAPKPVKTTKPAAKATAKPKATTKPTSADKANASATPTPTATATATDDAKAGAASKPDADKTTDAPAAAAGDTTATEDPQEVVLADESTDTTKASAETESGGTGSAGLVILGGLAGAGVLAVAGYSVARKRKGITS